MSETIDESRPTEQLRRAAAQLRETHEDRFMLAVADWMDDEAATGEVGGDEGMVLVSALVVAQTYLKQGPLTTLATRDALAFALHDLECSDRCDPTVMGGYFAKADRILAAVATEGVHG